MQIVRLISELGQTIRAEKGLKVRQPLASLEVEFSTEEDNQGAYLAPWMQDIIAAELNVKEVRDVPKINDSDKFVVEEDKSQGIKIALQTELTPELKEAGLIREFIRKLQSMRKQTGMQVGERIEVTYFTNDQQLREIITKNSEEIRIAVSADKLSISESGEKVFLNDIEVTLSMYKVE